MSRATKICLIIGAVLVILGLVIFTMVMNLNHWDFTKLSTVKYVTNTYSFNESFTDISIETDAAEIVFALSEDDSCKVICQDQEDLLHKVSVQDGTLEIYEEDNRQWYDHFGVSFGSSKLTVYLPQSVYGTLSVNADTGKVTLPRDFTFESMELDLTTGQVDTSASVSGIATLNASTGDISVDGITAGTLSISVTTGKVTVSDVTCQRDVSIGVTTGKASVTDLTCANLASHGSTGDLTLSNVVASGSFDLERSTGDIRFERCDAAEITAEADTGSITGSLCSSKIFRAQSDTGRVDVPQSTTGGKCVLTTDTGSIKITVEE